MLQSPLAKITTLIAVAIVGWAVARGRWPERIAAIAVAIDWAATILFQDRRHHHHGQPVMFAFDAAMATVFLILALRYRRTWLLWAAAFGLLLIFTHVTASLDPTFGQWSYMTVIYIWSLGVLIALGLGVWLEGATPARRVAWSR